MGDSSHIICVDGIFENNKQLVNDLIVELQREQIIESDLTDSVLGGLGFRKGSHVAKAVLDPAEGAGLSLNGVRILLQPAAYYTVEINPQMQIICPECNQDWFKDISVADFYSEILTKDQLKPYYSLVKAIEAYSGEPQLLTCHHCSANSDITEYDYSGMLSFSNLALEFLPLQKNRWVVFGSGSAPSA